MQIRSPCEWVVGSGLGRRGVGGGRSHHAEPFILRWFKRFFSAIQKKSVYMHILNDFRKQAKNVNRRIFIPKSRIAVFGLFYGGFSISGEEVQPGAGAVWHSRAAPTLGSLQGQAEPGLIARGLSPKRLYRTERDRAQATHLHSTTQHHSIQQCINVLLQPPPSLSLSSRLFFTSLTSSLSFSVSSPN